MGAGAGGAIQMCLDLHMANERFHPGEHSRLQQVPQCGLSCCARGCKSCPAG
jgi:hypothetical protein